MDKPMMTRYLMAFILCSSTTTTTTTIFFCDSFSPTTKLRTNPSHLNDYHSASILAATAITTAGTPKPLDVVITRVETEQDWIAFADLRYDEWILNSDKLQPLDPLSTPSTTPSRQAFRLATREIYMEERPRSILILAKQGEGQYSLGQKVLGGAEMSPYEVEAGLRTSSSSSSSSIPVFLAGYVTDVVTDRCYRKQGIARRMMTTLEDLARAHGMTHLVLNVKHDNEPARRLYQQQLGYHDVPSAELLQSLNISQLENEAGTSGQLLLEKKIDKT